jgi:hypothetical protein
MDVTRERSGGLTYYKERGERGGDDVMVMVAVYAYSFFNECLVALTRFHYWKEDYTQQSHSPACGAPLGEQILVSLAHSPRQQRIDDKNNIPQLRRQSLPLPSHGGGYNKYHQS